MWVVPMQSSVQALVRVDVKVNASTRKQKRIMVNTNVRGAYRACASLSKKRRLVLDNCKIHTFSQIKYIIWLYRLSQIGCGVKNVELSGALGVSKPSVHNMLKSLSDLGIVRQESFGLAYLTEKGRNIAQKYVYCYNILEKKMSEICGDGAVSENAICALLADMTMEKINELYQSQDEGNE